MNWWQCPTMSRLAAEKIAKGLEGFSAIDLGPLQEEEPGSWGVAKWNGIPGTAMEGFFAGISENGSRHPYAYADHGGEVEVEAPGPGYSGDMEHDTGYALDFIRDAVAEMEEAMP